MIVRTRRFTTTTTDSSIIAGGGDGRSRLAVIINGEENIVVEDRVKEAIYKHLRKKFSSSYFAVMKGTDINTMLLQYAEEQYYDKREETLVNSAETVSKKSTVDVDGLPVGIQPRGLSDMRREDYVRAGRKCGYDYVFVITLANGRGTIDNHNFILFNTNTVHKNVWLRLRLVDVSTGDYLYRSDIPAAGKTHNGKINGRVMERAVYKAMAEAMDDISIQYDNSGNLPPAPNSYR